MSMLFLLKASSRLLVFIGSLFATLAVLDLAHATERDFLTKWTEVRFDLRWCPRPEEITKMEAVMKLTMNGCCVRSALVIPNVLPIDEILAPWSQRLKSSTGSVGECTGQVLSVEDQTAADRANKIGDIIELTLKVKELEVEESRLKRELKEAIRSGDDTTVCAEYGSALRAGPDKNEFFLIAQTEARKRGLRLSPKLAMAKRVSLGMTRCQMYAVLGEPDSVNRTVSRREVHIQHNYDGTYVYTTNGVITSWQD
jgi:hypothetical protein